MILTTWNPVSLLNLSWSWTGKVLQHWCSYICITKVPIVLQQWQRVQTCSLWNKNNSWLIGSQYPLPNYCTTLPLLLLDQFPFQTLQRDMVLKGIPYLHLFCKSKVIVCLFHEYTSKCELCETLIYTIIYYEYGRSEYSLHVLPVQKTG